MFTSVSNRRDGIEIVMSNQEKETPRVKRLLKEGKLAYINKATLPSELTDSAQGDQLTIPSEVSYSKSKDTTLNAEIQTNEQKFSLITPEMDASYLDAVERGDMETAQRMVVEAAKLAMPNTKVVDVDGNPKVVYHGTPNEFTVFGEDISSKHPWTYEGTYYFTDNEANAKTYGGRSVGAFLNITNPYEYDFEGRAWKNLEIGIAVRYARDFSILASGFKTKEEAEAWRENYIKENPDSPLVKDADHIIVDETAILGQAGPTTDEQTQIAKEGGYDGNIQYNIVDVGDTEMYEEDGVFRERVDEEALKPRTNYIAFEPSQIKSADPVTYDDAGNVIPLSERFNPENKDIRYSISSEEDILFEKKTAFLTDLVREYNISLPTFIAQTKEEFRRMALEYGIPEKDIDEDEGKGCYCEDDNIILINGGLMSKPSEMNGTLLHEHGHYITISYLSDRVEELANRLNPEDIEVTRQEVYGKGYSDKNASEIINELVSFMVGRLQKEEAIAIFEGQISIQEFIDKWIQDINGNARSESAKATLYEILPLVKDNIELQKKQYGAERTNTIVIARREYVQADDRGYTKTTLYSGQEHRSIEAQPRDATPDRRGEGADAQEVGYCHFLEEIIDTPLDEEDMQR